MAKGRLPNEAFQLKTLIIKTDFSGAKIGAFNSGNSSAAAGKGAKATTKAGGKKVVRMGGMSMGKPAPTEGFEPPAGKPGTGGVSTTPTPPAMGKPAPTMTEGKPPSGRPGKPGRPMGKPGRPMGRPGKPRPGRPPGMGKPGRRPMGKPGRRTMGRPGRRPMGKPGRMGRPMRMGPKMMGPRRPGRRKSDPKEAPEEAKFSALEISAEKLGLWATVKKAMKIRRRIKRIRARRKPRQSGR